jgi:hypothetical protein
MAGVSRAARQAMHRLAEMNAARVAARGSSSQSSAASSTATTTPFSWQRLFAQLKQPQTAPEWVNQVLDYACTNSISIPISPSPLAFLLHQKMMTTDHVCYVM